jgi:hypothetical protein
MISKKKRKYCLKIEELDKIWIKINSPRKIQNKKKPKQNLMNDLIKIYAHLMKNSVFN